MALTELALNDCRQDSIAVSPIAPVLPTGRVIINEPGIETAAATIVYKGAAYLPSFQVIYLSVCLIADEAIDFTGGYRSSRLAAAWLSENGFPSATPVGLYQTADPF